MTDEQTPPDWVLIEAAKRSGRPNAKVSIILNLYEYSDTFRALCDMIQKYEHPPVDRKEKCALEAVHSADMSALGWDETTAAAAERAKIVAWLRTYPEGYDIDDNLVDAIEAGEHLK